MYMKSFCRKIYLYRFELALSLFTLLMVFSPYLRPDLVTGSDYPFHLARIETLAQNLHYGIFPTKVHVDLCYGYGYGVGFFYPDFFLYIPALLQVLGLSLEVSFKLFAGMIQTGIFLSVFFCVYSLTRQRYAALSCAVILMFSDLVLDSFYFSFTLGTSLGLVFLPPAICGMYLFLAEDRSPFMLGLGFTGLILSHVLSTTLALIVCFVFLLLHIRKLIAAPARLLTLTLTVLAVSGLTACFWLPMFEQFLAQQYRVSQPWTWVDENVLYLLNLFRSDGPGLILLLIAFFLSFERLIFLQRDKSDTTLQAAGDPSCSAAGSGASDPHGIRQMCMPPCPTDSLPAGMNEFLLFGLVLLILPLCGHFWRLFRNAFKFLQFPKRLLAPASILLLFAFGIRLSRHPLSERHQKYAALFLFLLSLSSGISYLESHATPIEDFGGRVLYQEIAGLGAGEEWLPLETTREHLTDPLSVVSDGGVIVTGSRNQPFFTFQPEDTAQYYDVPLVWYRGYAAVDESGSPLKTGKNPENGLVRVYTADRKSASSVTVWYQGTWLQTVSYLISLLSFLLLLCGAIYRYHHRKEQSKRNALAEPLHINHES